MSMGPLALYSGRRTAEGAFEEILEAVFEIELGIIRECAAALRRPDFLTMLREDPGRLRMELHSALEKSHAEAWGLRVRAKMEREIRAWLRGQADTREPIFKAALEAGLLDSSAVTLANSPVLRHYQRKAFTSIRDSIGRAVTAAKDSAADDVLRQGALALSAGEGRDAADRVIWRATGELAELGVTGDSGPSGRRISLEAFARREINTTLNNASRNMQWERAREWGSDLIIVSAHAGARPKCRPWQGKVYSLAPGNPDRMYIGDTSYGEPAGLFGINCRHFSMPFFEGLNTEYPEDFRDPEGVLRREDGSEVTDAEIYEAEQGQRYLERNVRKRRKEAARFAAAGEDDRAAGARALARAWEGRLAGHIRESNSRGVDLVRQRERERVWTGA